MKKLLLSEQSPITKANSKFPIFARFYNSQGNLLQYKDGAIPFFVKLESGFSNDFFVTINKNITTRRRLSKEYIFENSYVYEINDFGANALSASLEDFVPFCYRSVDGYKVKQRDIVLIKNFTNKTTYILIPKNVFLEADTNFNLDIIIEFRKQANRNTALTAINRVNGVFTINMKDLGLSSLDDLQLYYENNLNSIITASDYFFSTSKANFPTDGLNKTYITKQAEYFEKLTIGQNQLGVKEDIEVEILENLAINTIYALNRQNLVDIQYKTQSSVLDLSILGNNIQLPDVYGQQANGFMKKLIGGIDYYIDVNNRLLIPNDSTSTLFEVIIRKDRKEKLFLPFSFATGNVFDLNEALYYRNIINWNVDEDKSFITKFENGLLYTGSYSNGNTYEVIIDDIVYSNIAIPSSNSNTVTFLNSSFTFNVIKNSYQLPSDPYLNTYGEIASSPSITQEFILQNQELGYKIEELEPRISGSINNYLIQGLVDPFSSTAFTTNIQQSLEDHQDGTNITTLLSDNDVQDIEKSIIAIKKNFAKIINNSSLPITEIISTNRFSTSDFLFLIIKDRTGKFDISYYNGNNIIKKEYSCECLDYSEITGTDKFYISVPYFNFTHIQIEGGLNGTFYRFK